MRNTCSMTRHGQNLLDIDQYMYITYDMTKHLRHLLDTDKSVCLSMTSYIKNKVHQINPKPLML